MAFFPISQPAQALNLPKTDAVDAQMLARFGAERQLEATSEFDPVRAELAEITGRRAQLKRMETQEKNRLDKARHPEVRQDIKDQLEILVLRIKGIEKAIKTHIQAHQHLDAANTLLRSIPGIGPVASACLLAHMPELGTRCRRKIASLGGLAPRARDSGKWRGHRFIGDVRRLIRQTLYLAAVNLMRKGSPFEKAVTDMRAKGKPGKVIIIAIARKLLTIANAVIRNASPYHPETA